MKNLTPRAIDDFIPRSARDNYIQEVSMHRNQRRVSRVIDLCIKAVSIATITSLLSVAHAQPLPTVPFPAENQFSQAKSDLGKILFWDEQLSSDNTMSCGTCHQPSAAGTDPRLDLNPGSDQLFGTADDIAGSPGMIMQNQDEEFMKSVLFDLLPQVTPRQAPPSIMAMYAPETFWDGRAGGEFRDPVTNELLIAAGGALENQAIGPPTSDTEMAHQSRSWDQIIDKLEGARPLALSSDLPADLAAVITQGDTYPELFEEAFGDDEITAGRIGMAIATYERTLVPDQSPFDQFVAGNPNAMTQAQINGMNAFRGSRCNSCHTGSQFTDNSFRNVGLRPTNEDSGRFEVTKVLADRGRFKVPSLRNTGLRDRFMHNGQLDTIQQVFDFYARRNGQVSFPQNRDPLLGAPIAFPPPVQSDIEDFLVNALTDQRVTSESFPFDRPLLFSEQPNASPQIIGDGAAGSGARIPEMIAQSPSNIGNDGFKVGVNNALGGAQAFVALSTSPPVDGVIAQDQLLGPIMLEGTGIGNGFGTMHWPIPNIIDIDGQTWYMQWMISDPGAAGGVALSPVAEFTTFCSMHGTCISTCQADMNIDNSLNFLDVSAFLASFAASEPVADFNNDGLFNFIDVSEFIVAFGEGCP
jgi:cytochrome c peroxidase